jgi:hypothetical protein
MSIVHTVKTEVAISLEFINRLILWSSKSVFPITGDLSRDECENLLGQPTNPSGAFMVRYSNNRQQFILSGSSSSSHVAVHPLRYQVIVSGSSSSS